MYDRMWKRINGCSDRPMSRVGKEVFLKFVIQAITLYVMSYFQLPGSSCEDMTKYIANHWWGIDDANKKLPWRSLEILTWLTTPKALGGGLEFWDIELFNRAMLACHGWRQLIDLSSLRVHVIKGRYYPNCDIWEAQQPRSSMYAW
jgi:hypothetical protein